MSNKIAVVTGAGGGMGSAITARLVQDKFHVIALDLNTESLEKLKASFPNDVTTFTVDLTSADKIAEVFKSIKSKFGGVDALVNNAGDCFMSEFPNIPAAEFDKQMAVNFSSAFHCSQESVKLMLERPGIKKIVNISSNGAYNFDVFDPPHYRAS